uniref:Gag-pol polyprotein n=1 Tax=Strongyloides papillosus TaxID=174720 RepID=A0A0N5BER2_STREA
MYRLDTPVFPLRANKRRSHFFRIEHENFDDHFKDFIKNIVAACSIRMATLLTNTEVDGVNESTRDLQRSEKALQTLVKIEFLYALPTSIGQELENKVRILTILELKDKAAELVLREKDKRAVREKWHDNDRKPKSTRFYKSSKPAKINTVQPQESFEPMGEGPSGVSIEDQHLDFRKPILTRIL